jgi:hypothetical protein
VLISAAAMHSPFVPSLKSCAGGGGAEHWVPWLVAGALSRLLLGAYDRIML